MNILLHPGFDDVTDVNTDPKGRFVSFKVKLIHLRIATENNWLGNASLKVYSLYGKQNQGE